MSKYGPWLPDHLTQAVTSCRVPKRAPSSTSIVPWEEPHSGRTAKYVCRASDTCSRLLMYYSLAADPCGPAKHCPVFHCPPSGLATPAHDRDDHVDGHPDHDHDHPGGLHPVQLKQKTTRCRKNWAQTLV